MPPSPVNSATLQRGFWGALAWDHHRSSAPLEQCSAVNAQDLGAPREIRWRKQLHLANQWTCCQHVPNILSGQTQNEICCKRCNDFLNQQTLMPFKRPSRDICSASAGSPTCFTPRAPHAFRNWLIRPRATGFACAASQPLQGALRVHHKSTHSKSSKSKTEKL
jgi:hypothetical protein